MLVTSYTLACVVITQVFTLPQSTELFIWFVHLCECCTSIKKKLKKTIHVHTVRHHKFVSPTLVMWRESCVREVISQHIDRLEQAAKHSAAEGSSEPPFVVHPY